MKNILIVEDESIVALEISGFVQSLGYEVVSCVATSVAALKVIQSSKIDLVLMDVQIKGDEDGVECSRKIKEHSNIPIIYISAFSDDKTLQRAIATKPSSYLLKPFNTSELKVAMLIAIKKDDDILKVGDIILDDEFSFDSKTHELILRGEIIHLTRQEQKLLSLLVSAKNNIVSIYDVENRLWGNKSSNENTRRALISRLRSKLNHKFIQTHHGIGYRLNI